MSCVPDNFDSSGRRPQPPSTATVLHIDTATLVGATLRLGKRPLESKELRQLKENLNWRAASGDQAARMALRWLAVRTARTEVLR